MGVGIEAHEYLFGVQQRHSVQSQKTK